MAEDIDPQVLADLFQEYEDGIITMAELRTSMRDLNVTTSTTEAVTKKLGDGLLHGVAGVSQFTKSVTSGSTGLSSMSGVIDSASSAISGLTGMIPVVGGALSALVKGTSASAKFVLDQMDASFQSFQQVSDVGVIGAKGLLGLSEQAKEAGIPLKLYSAMLKSNAKDLSYIYGTSLAGSKEYSKAVSAMMTGSDNQLRKLGFTVEEVGDAVIDFQKRNKQLGINQIYSQATLIKQATAYGKEMDTLAKLTGESRKDVEKSREAMRSETKFRAFISKEGNKSLQKSYENMAFYVEKTYGSSMGKGFRDLMSNVLNSPEARQLTLAGLDAPIRMIQDRIISAGGDWGKVQESLPEFTSMFADAANQFKKDKAGIASIMDPSQFNTIYGSFAQYADAAGKKMISEFDVDAIKNAQDKQIGATDAVTSAAISVENSLMAMQISITDTVLHMNDLPEVTAEFAKSMSEAVQWIADNIRSAPEKGYVATATDWLRGKLSTYDSMVNYVSNTFTANTEKVEAVTDAYTASMAVASNLMTMTSGTFEKSVFSMIPGVGVLSSVMNITTADFKNMGSNFNSTVDYFTNNLVSGSDKAVTLITAMGDGIIKYSTVAVDIVKTNATDFANIISDNASMFTNMAINTASDLKSKAKSVSDELIAQVSQLSSDVFGRISESISGTLDTVMNSFTTFSDLLDKAISWIRDALDFSSLYDESKKVIADTVASITSTVDTSLNNMFNNQDVQQPIEKEVTVKSLISTLETKIIEKESLTPSPVANITQPLEFKSIPRLSKMGQYNSIPMSFDKQSAVSQVGKPEPLTEAPVNQQVPTQQKVKQNKPLFSMQDRVDKQRAQSTQEKMLEVQQELVKYLRSIDESSKTTANYAGQ